MVVVVVGFVILFLVVGVVVVILHEDDDVECNVVSASALTSTRLVIKTQQTLAVI